MRAFSLQVRPLFSGIRVFFPCRHLLAAVCAFCLSVSAFDAKAGNAVSAPVPDYERIGGGVARLHLWHALQKALHGLPGDLQAAAPGLDLTWVPVITALSADGFAVDELVPLFARLGPKSYTPAYMAAKVAELHHVPSMGIDRSGMPPPEPPPGYRPPVTDVTVGSCLDFLRDHDAIFADIETTYGVDRATLLALLLVESQLGLHIGQDSALRVLASMAAADSPEKLAARGNAAQVTRIAAPRLNATLQERSARAYRELTALLRYGQACALDAASMPASHFGAVGLCQFMPCNIEPYGVDGDGDGHVNLFSVTDALYSAAGYLEAHGWRQAKSREAKLAVLMAYNHDSLYAAAVSATARQAERAMAGKLRRDRHLVAGPGIVPSARLDPSLRRLRPVPRAGRVKALGDYRGLLE